MRDRFNFAEDPSGITRPQVLEPLPKGLSPEAEPRCRNLGRPMGRYLVERRTRFPLASVRGSRRSRGSLTDSAEEREREKERTKNRFLLFFLPTSCLRFRLAFIGSCYIERYR